MTNEEIDTRLKFLTDGIFARAKELYKEFPDDAISNELECLNAMMLGILTMLGEIAKRLPECKR